uniref:Uncharacterized protein n=1 Tax=Tetranychus urticae TaxID=32264 RepID=T1KK58_TETUR
MVWSNEQIDILNQLLGQHGF